MTYFTKRYHPPGTVPGTLTADESVESAPGRIDLVDYNGDELIERHGIDPEECKRYLHGPNTTWIHVQGRVAPDILRQLGEAFSLHSLALEDILNIGQRPKAEFYEDQAFIILGMPVFDDDTVKVEQISLFLGEKYVVSFADGAEDPFAPVRHRLKVGHGRMRNRKADYLLYALVDLVLDHGFPVLEELGSRIESLEEELLERTDKKMLAQIHFLKRELLLIRRRLWPHMEVLNQLMHSEDSYIEEKTMPFLRDCYDHVVHIIELIETYRESMSTMQEIYLSNLSNRMSDVMRVLTMIATIFIPLTFIAGVYGMNFDSRASPWNMPELHWYYGYPAVLGIMLATVAGLLVLFRKKKWV